MPPRILVGCPTAHFKAYCLDAYMQRIKTLSYSNYDIILVDNSLDDAYYKKLQIYDVRVIKDEHIKKAKRRITHSRNIIRKIVLDEDYDYFLSLEQDVIPPKNIIELLLAHQKKVVSGVVYSKFFLGEEQEQRIKPLMWKATSDKDKMSFADTEIQENKGLIPIKACGLGCILIAREVLEKILFRLTEDESTYDDIPFCTDVVEAGYTLYGDTNIKCTHMIEGMDWDAVDQ